MKKIVVAALIAAQIGSPVLAQDETMTAAAPSVDVSQEASLAANTQILLSMNSEITSTTHRAGDTFPMSVANDVRLGDRIVIPRGTRAVGEVTWRTGRGAFGKSGKMDIALRYIDLEGTRIPVEGFYRQEGEGNTLATVGGVILVGVFAGFITGSRARIPAGRELAAHTLVSVPFVSSENAMRISPVFGSQLAEWRATPDGSVEGQCRASSRARAEGNAERLERFTRECVAEAATP